MTTFKGAESGSPRIYITSSAETLIGCVFDGGNEYGFDVSRDSTLPPHVIRIQWGTVQIDLGYADKISAEAEQAKALEAGATHSMRLETAVLKARVGRLVNYIMETQNPDEPAAQWDWDMARRYFLQPGDLDLIETGQVPND